MSLIKSFFVFSILGLLFLVESCSLKFYAPTTAATPLFRQKGEAQLSGSLGNGDEINQSLQGQFAYAFDSSVAVYGTLYSAKGGVEKENQTSGKGSQFELGIGYFNTLTRKTSYEIYGGFAYGSSAYNTYRTYESKTKDTRQFPVYVNSTFIKPFVQGNYGYRSPYFDAILNLRLGYLNIKEPGELESNMDTSYVGVPNEDVDRVKSAPNSFLVEPGITLRFGYEPLKLQLHTGWSFNSNGDKYPQENIVFSVGLVGMLNSATKKKKTPPLNF
ncbi:MAG: hypothetical protein ACKVQB_10510 [Bacteroidia bacterium]